jgi:hypothetical protein
MKAALLPFALSFVALGCSSSSTSSSVAEDGGLDVGAATKTDAGGTDASNDATAMCPSFSTATQNCSQTCYGDCYGTDDAGVADPSVHVGGCIFVGTVSFYCAPFGVSNPCSYCP